jgi:Iap family predicted aminopeptidase
LWGSPAGVVEGELLDLGNGTAGDYAEQRDKIPGKIVLLSSKRPAYAGRQLRASVKQAQAIQAGAAGIIWVRHDAGMLLEAGTIGWGIHAPIPGVSITNESAGELRRALARGPVKIRLELTNRRVRSTGWNVVGDLHGSGETGDFILAGAHYDTYDIGCGVLDNASSVVILLEAARVLAQHGNALKGSIRFVFFSGEELGLIGSQNYVARHRADLEKIYFMLNLDGPGRREEVGIAVQGWDELVVQLRNINKSMNEGLLVDNYVVPYCDAFPFCEAGVPAATLFPIGEMPERGWNHTAADSLDKVRPADLRRDSILTARLLLHASAAPEWLPRHKSADQIEKLLTIAGYREILEAEGRWFQKFPALVPSTT